MIIGGFALLRHVNLCDGQILARSAIEYNMWLAMKDIVAPYFEYVGIGIIVSYTVTHDIRRHSRRLVREMLPVTEPGHSELGNKMHQ